MKGLADTQTTNRKIWNFSGFSHEATETILDCNYGWKIQKSLYYTLCVKLSRPHIYLKLLLVLTSPNLFTRQAWLLNLSCRFQMKVKVYGAGPLITTCKLPLVLSLPNLTGWRMLWYWCTRHAWILNLSHSIVGFGCGRSSHI